MSVIRVKDGVAFSVIAPGGFRILSAIDQVAVNWPGDLTITSGTDGEHSGPPDPHHTGNAYDVRSQNMLPAQKPTFLSMVMAILGWDHFYGFLEAEGTENEHFHFQVKKGTTYP